MKILLPTRTRVECTYKELKAFENYLNLCNIQTEWIRNWVHNAQVYKAQFTHKSGHCKLTEYTIYDPALKKYVRISNKPLIQLLEEFIAISEPDDESV